MHPLASRHAIVGAALVVAAVAAGACAPDDLDPGRNRRNIASSEVAPSGSSTATPRGGPSCSNGVRDGDETDVDCGGKICPACANGRACTAPSDCASLACTDAKCSNDAGCADGTREGFASATTFPNIAACAGAWSIPGLGTTTTPACGHVSGNSSANPTGTGCNVADLCQVGWRVCDTAALVGVKSGGIGCAAAGIAGQGAFYAIRQSSSGGAACGDGTNDLFGCGDVGEPADLAACLTVDRFSNDLCVALPATWACGTNNTEELNNVAKTASEGGGVLCCRD